jgi:hypothetical protein
MLEDDAGPLARERLRTAVEAAGGHFFDSPRGYKQHVGRLLFGLAPTQYDELLRLLYWLRQPQVGEDIEPARLAEQLVQALPQLDDDAVRAAGDTFDELAAVRGAARPPAAQRRGRRGPGDHLRALRPGGAARAR